MVKRVCFVIQNIKRKYKAKAILEKNNNNTFFSFYTRSCIK